MDDDLLDPFVRLLTDLSAPATVRHAEKDGSAPELWAALLESGFLDALVPESHGGVGLSPEDIASLVIACGEHLVPLPVGETIIARALLTRNGVDAPDAPILLWPQSEDGSLLSPITPQFSTGCHVLVQSGSRMTLVRAERGERDGFGLPTVLVPADASPIAVCEASDIDLLGWAAAITSAYMAGAMNRVIALSIDHASMRNQFGRPLSKFQAIQHHMAVMAERVASANAATRFAFASDELRLNLWRVAVAKSMVNQSAPECCGLAHAIHGAIGISEEHDLQLYTRRIKRWQLSFGAEGFWARRVAIPWLERDGENSIDTIRRQG